MLNIATNNKEKITVTAAPNGPIDGALRITVQDGDATFEQDPATPLAFKAVSGAVAGQSHYLVEGDVRAGAEVVLISEVVEYTVSQAEATAFGLSAGAVEPK